MRGDKQESTDRLKEWIKPGDTAYTILRHCARSGMMREIGVVVFIDGKPRHPNHAIATVLDRKQGKRDGVLIRGCGMDMGFALINELERTLGYPITQAWL